MLKNAVALAGVLIAGLMTTPASTFAQDLSGRPVTIIVPYPPGASADTTTRLVSHQVEKESGLKIIIENRPGGAGAVGAAAAKNAAPDGHTLYLSNAGIMSTNPLLRSNLPYDPVKDFKAVAVLWSFPSFLAIPASLPVASVKDLLELAKKRDKGLSYASQGAGSGGHVLGALLANKAKVPMTHIPYQGGAPAVKAVASGEADLLFASYASFKPHVDAGRVKLLAVSSPQRLKSVPEVPTMAEVGYPAVEDVIWWGLWAPAGTDNAIVQKLHDLFVKAVATPAITKQLTEDGLTVEGDLAPSQVDALVKSDLGRYKTMLTDAGIKIAQ